MKRLYLFLEIIWELWLGIEKRIDKMWTYIRPRILLIIFTLLTAGHVYGRPGQ